MDIGAIVEVGRLRGEFVGADPSGRYVAVQLGSVLTVHDTRDALAPVASWPVGDRVAGQVEVHPNGNAFVAPSGSDGRLELWRTGSETPIPAPAENAGSPPVL